MVERRQVSEWSRRSIPVLLVAFLWVGLWQMWPEYTPLRLTPQRKPLAIKWVDADDALKMIKDPTAFAFDSDVSFQSESRGSPELLRMPGMPEGRREFLKMSGQTLKARDKGSVSEYSIWERTREEFSGAWGEDNTFELRKPENQLVVEVSDNLVSSGYAPAEFSEDDFKGSALGWEVQVLLDLDKTGVPAHVLIVKGSGNKDIDEVVRRRILFGRSDRKEVRGGRIKVSYGFE